MKEFFKLLFSYIKRHTAIVITLIFSIIIFILVFSLYSLPLESVFYAAALSLFVASFIALIRFIPFYRKHKYLKNAEKTITETIVELPYPTSIIEEDYIKLIKLLDSSRKKIISEKDKAMTDMIDYYTLWAHQIKTPIAAARLILQSDETNNPELSEQLFRIEQYVDMVLGYLRAENISGDLLIKKYLLDDIIKTAVKKYAGSFIRKRITLEYKKTDLKVLTDDKWLTFVLEQIISNALKYTFEGKITISCTENSITVTDTRIGICAEDLPRLGEKGFTGYNGRADKKSTGIGLYLCNKILKKLSHSMVISSELGQGTAVTINLSKM